jgi:hypothetical protein
METKVDARVLMEERAKLSWVYEKRLKKIAKLARTIAESEYIMGADDIEALCEIRELAEKTLVG